MDELRIIAEKMACDVRGRLLKKEADENRGNPPFLNGQSCGFPDLAREMQLIAGNGLSKDMPFDPNSLVKTGDWEALYNNSRPTPVVFNALTRSR